MIYREGDIITTKCSDYMWPLCKHYGIVTNYNNKMCVFHNSPGKFNSAGGNIVAQPLNEFLKERCVMKVDRSNIKSKDVIKYSIDRKYIKWNMGYNCVKYIEDIKGLEKR
jgi:hypothetical protein